MGPFTCKGWPAILLRESRFGTSSPYVPRLLPCDSYSTCQIVVVQSLSTLIISSAMTSLPTRRLPACHRHPPPLFASQVAACVSPPSTPSFCLSGGCLRVTAIHPLCLPLRRLPACHRHPPPLFASQAAACVSPPSSRPPSMSPRPWCTCTRRAYCIRTSRRATSCSRPPEWRARGSLAR